MKNCYQLLLFLVLINVCYSAHSQQLLSNSYQSIKDESIKYNSQVSAIYYQETPIVLMVAKSNDMLEYLQTYMFSNQQCISETQCYPASLFEKKYIYLTALYGEPGETMFGNNKMYVWRTKGMRITLTLNYTGITKTNVAQINYAKDSDMDAIVDVSQKSQSPFSKSVILKNSRQDKIGFAIQKVSMMGYEANATGTVTFNESFTEMEIKQHILPSDGKPEKNPKYQTTHYKLDGMRLDGKGYKEFKGLDIVFTGAAISEGNPNVNVTVVLDNEGCSLEIPAFGYMAEGNLLLN